MWHWLVIVARDRPELWLTWRALYGGAEGIEILVDRRQGPSGTRMKDDRRARSPRDHDLQERGFLMIPESVNSGASPL